MWFHEVLVWVRDADYRTLGKLRYLSGARTYPRAERMALQQAQAYLARTHCDYFVLECERGLTVSGFLLRAGETRLQILIP